MSAHQATVDYVNQILPTCSTEEGHRGRCEENQFAEKQGSLNHEWLSLQEALNSQVGKPFANEAVDFTGFFKALKHITRISACFRLAS